MISQSCIIKTSPLGLRTLFLMMAALLFLLSRGPAMAASAEPMELPAEETPSCFDQIWENAHGHPWFVDENGREIVPEVRLDWLIVHFLPSDATARTGKVFFERYPEVFAEQMTLQDASVSSAVYRLHQNLPFGLFQELMQRWAQDPLVHSIRPAWRIEEQFHMPLDKIEVTWKTASDLISRQRLLESIDALDEVTGKGPHTDLLTIDPCQGSAWQTAALLSEELLVASARPLTRPILPPLRVDFRLTPPGAMAGMPIPFSLEIHFEEGISVETATIANLNLAPSGIFHNLYTVHFDHPPSAIDLSSSPIRINGTLHIYASGDYQLPALPIFYTDRRGEEARPATLTTEGVAIRIASIVPEETTAYRLQVAVPTTLPQLQRTDLKASLTRTATLGGVGVLLLVFALILHLKNRRRRPEADPETDPLRRQRAHAELAARLKEASPPLQRAEWATLGHSLRAVLANYAERPTIVPGGSYRALLKQLEEDLSADQRKQAGSVLEQIEYLLAGQKYATDQQRTLLGEVAALLNSLDPAGKERPLNKESR